MRNLLLWLFFSCGMLHAQIVTTTGSGNWSSTVPNAPWPGGTLPAVGATVQVGNGHTLTVDGNYTSAAFTVLSGNLNSTVSFNTGSSLTTGAVTIQQPTANNIQKRIEVNDGTLTCSSVSYTASGADSRKQYLTATTGTITIGGNLVMNSNQNRHYVEVTGNANVNVTGNFTGGSVNFTNGTLNLNGPAQTLAGGASAVAYNLFNLRCNTSNAKTLGAAIVCRGNLEINGTARLDVSASNFGVTVGGNWNISSSNANPFVERSGTVTFNGSSGVQTINTVLAGGETFYRLFINNTSASKPSLSSLVNLTVSNDYDHSNGFLDLTGNNLTSTNASAQTFDLTGGGIITSVGGSTLDITTNGVNNLRVNFYNFEIGDAVNGLNINVTTEDSYFTNSIFYGPMVVTKTGTAGNDTQGGNIFFGPITFNTIASGDRWRMGHANGDVFHNLTINHEGASNFITGRQASGNQYYGTTTLNSSTAGGIFIGRRNGNAGTYTHEFFGPVVVNVTFTGNVNFADADATRIQNVTFHNTIQLNSNAASTGNVRLGFADAGSVTLTGNGQLIPGSIEGLTTIYLYRIIENSGLPQSVICDPISTGWIECGNNVAGNGCVFSGNVTFDAPRVMVRQSTFNGASNAFHQFGTVDNANWGNNIFNGDATVVLSGTGNLSANAGPDDFKGTSTFIRTGTGLLTMANAGTSTFSGDISTLGSTAPVAFSTLAGSRALLDGNLLQTMDGPALASPTFGELEINNPSGGLFNCPATITRSLTFTNGIIHNNSNLITFNNNAVALNASNNSFASGIVRKVGNQAFEFPVGDNGFYAPISISAPGNAAHHFTCQYFDVNPDAQGYDVSLFEPALDHISTCEHWILDRTNGASNVSVTLSWETARSCSVTNPSTLRVARWDGAEWRSHGNGGFTGGPGAGTIVTSAPVTAFSPFTLASSDTENPLPVEWLYAEAIVTTNKTVEVLWGTASEANTSHYEIERMLANGTFSKIGELGAAGYSSTRLDYRFTDSSPVKGVNSYRIKQVDLDGGFEYSNVVTARLNNQNDEILIWPNPSADGIVSISGVLSGETLEIIDMNGRSVFSGVVTSANIQLPVLASGIYAVKVTGIDRVVTTKLIVE